MATTTQTIHIPSSNLHVDPQETQSRGAPSDLGTLDRLDSPGAESSISQVTRGPPTYLPTAQPNPATGDEQSRLRTNSNLSPPQQQGEWAAGRTSTDAQGRPSLSRPRSNSNRYYAEARERSGTVNSGHSQGHQHTTSQDKITSSFTQSPPQQPRTFLESSTPATLPPHPQTPAPAYSSPPGQYQEHFAPQAAPAAPVQPDVNPLSSPSGAGEPAMVTQLDHLNVNPALVDCPRCQKATYTTVTKEAGDAVTLWAVVLCCVTGVLCAWLPCVIDDCKDTVHRCSECQLLLATVTSSGNVRIAQGVSKPVVSQYQARAQMQAQTEKPMEEQQPWPGQQHRDAGPAPAGWENTAVDRMKPYEHPQQQSYQMRQEAASVPLAEMEDTREPIELPASLGPGWLGQSSKSPTNEKDELKKETSKAEKKEPSEKESNL